VGLSMLQNVNKVFMAKFFQRINEALRVFFVTVFNIFSVKLTPQLP
jgi:hypothetical protein